MDLNGKVALVTGAANGIGMATVQQLLRNGLKGVSMCDIDSKNGEDAALSFTKEYGKDRIIFIKTDVTKEKDLEEAFKKTKETFGAIDIVINNAGIVGEERWEAATEINVKGVVRGTQLALDYMGKHKGGEGGTVVNIASVAGLGVKTACPVYDGTKFFVVGYSQSISVSFKEQFLRIYSISRKTSVGYSVSMFVSLLECLFETHSGVLSILNYLQHSITKNKDFVETVVRSKPNPCRIHGGDVASGAGFCT